MINHNINRDHIIDQVKKDLLGPSNVGTEIDISENLHFPSIKEADGPWIQSSNGEEILTHSTPPLRRYSMGVLFPIESVSMVDEEDLSISEITEDELEIEQAQSEYQSIPESPEFPTDTKNISGSPYQEEDDEDGKDITTLNNFNQNSIALSILTESRSDNHIQVKVTGGRYGRKLVNIGNETREWWLRKPIEILAEFEGTQFSSSNTKLVVPANISSINTEGLDIRVEIYSRPYNSVNENSNKLRILTICVVNRTDSVSGVRKDERCIFQSKFSVSVENTENDCGIHPYPSVRGDIGQLTDEDLSLTLLYRKQQTFAIGHGCAADWVLCDDTGLASSVSAEVMPIVEIPNVTPVVTRNDGTEILVSMRMLAGLDPDDDGSIALTELVDMYEEWINSQANFSDIPLDLQPTANMHILNNRESLRRMKEGLEYVKNDSTAKVAFQLANRAVLMQQVAVEGDKRLIRYDKESNKNVFEPPFIEHDLDNIPSGRGYWRPFQIAFLLTSIKSTADPNSSDRDIVDLLWFPTGGGKTEAYLGLTAFSVFMRRLNDPSDTGVQVLMRYTLRLLTSQQFQRASSLICAMELIRRENVTELGDKPISIGLWVGGGTSPNTYANAQETFNRMQKGNSGENSFSILQCPWCRAQIGPYASSTKATSVVGYRNDKLNKEIIIHCPDKDCQFYGKLPLYVVDESIYKYTPDLLIGTIDKFAQLSWRSDTRSLFGINDQGEQFLTPPSLIIQDELHLISGPLGSMAGMYETLIEELCTDRRNGNVITPKVISSTATIRRSAEQIHDLYNKRVALFPSSGLDIADSFFSSFARDDKGNLISGKKYVGLYNTNLNSAATSQVFTFASLLTAPIELPDEAKDPWWTIMAFYNSLRELGSSLSLLDFEVKNTMVAGYRRKGIPYEQRRYIRDRRELTGRTRDEELMPILDHLKVGYGSVGNPAYDVCLASNIIEVGIDIDRLALMLVVGQPKTTSQYIQVTGRVGRRWQQGTPGLVFTLYNVGKPRDTSHFERFRSYHQQLYANVEPASVTPFASPVIDRALAACIVAYTRQHIDITQNPDHPYPYPAFLVDKFRPIIEKRVKSIDPDELTGFNGKFDKIIDEWSTLQRSEWGRQFGSPKEDDLMASSSNYVPTSQERFVWRIPSSLRTVDAECQAEITRRYEEVQYE